MVKKINKDDVFVASKRVWLQKNTGTVDPVFIPKDIGYKENKKSIEQVCIAIAHKIPVLLIGETGTGKTSLIRHIAHETHNGFVRVNHNGGTSVEDIVGRWVLGPKGEMVWIDGLLVFAARNGYWYHADEINAAGPEIAFAYHALLDDDGYIVLAEKGNEVVIPHENFRFFAAMNPTEGYAGTKEVNKALLDRCLIIKMDYPAPKIEEQILIERTGIEKDVAERMVRSAGEIRNMYNDDKIEFVFSTRSLIYWAKMYKVYGKYMTSFENVVLNKLNEDDYTAIKDISLINFAELDRRNAKMEKMTKAEREAFEVLDKTAADTVLAGIDGNEVERDAWGEEEDPYETSDKSEGGI